MGIGMADTKELYTEHATHPAAPGSFPSIPKFLFRGKIIDVVQVNQRRWLEESCGLKILIDPILFWLVASQYFKNSLASLLSPFSSIEHYVLFGKTTAVNGHCSIDKLRSQSRCLSFHLSSN